MLARRIMKALCGLAGLLLATGTALAGTLSVRVVDASGHPVADAVVTLRPVGSAPPLPRVGSGYRVDQHNIEFHPFVSVVPVGASVAFPNLDPVKHHVYSFSPAKRFELKLFAHNEQRSIVFDRAGVVAVGCNIHDSMSAYIYVTDTAWTQQTGANGTAAFRDTPPRGFVLAVWHPYLRAPDGVVSRSLALQGDDRSETVSIRLRPAPMHAMGGY